MQRETCAGCGRPLMEDHLDITRHEGDRSLSYSVPCQVCEWCDRVSPQGG